MKFSAKTSLILLIGSAVLALVLDRLLIVTQLPIVSKALLVKPGMVLFGVPFFEKTIFGVVPLIALPLITAWFLLLPVTTPGDRRAWTAAWVSWRWAATAVLLTPVLMLVGGFVYKLIKDWLPKLLATVVESFGFKPTFYVWSEDTPLVGPLDGSLACLIGLVSGVWLLHRWLRK